MRVDCLHVCVMSVCVCVVYVCVSVLSVYVCVMSVCRVCERVECARVWERVCVLIVYMFV